MQDLGLQSPIEGQVESHAALLRWRKTWKERRAVREAGGAPCRVLQQRRLQTRVCRRQQLSRAGLGLTTFVRCVELNTDLGVGAGILRHAPHPIPWGKGNGRRTAQKGLWQQDTETLTPLQNTGGGRVYQPRVADTTALCKRSEEEDEAAESGAIKILCRRTPRIQNRPAEDTRAAPTQTHTLPMVHPRAHGLS